MSVDSGRGGSGPSGSAIAGPVDHPGLGILADPILGHLSPQELRLGLRLDLLLGRRPAPKQSGELLGNAHVTKRTPAAATDQRSGALCVSAPRIASNSRVAASCAAASRRGNRFPTHFTIGVTPGPTTLRRIRRPGPLPFGFVFGYPGGGA